MADVTRRDWLGKGALVVAGAMAAGTVADAAPALGCLGEFGETVSLDGQWLFRVDPDDAGEKERWFDPSVASTDWAPVNVPHTWNAWERMAEYRGAAWYRTQFYAPPYWKGQAVRLEFEAVYHTAHVWLNGKPAGRHLGKGYTEFRLDISDTSVPGELNTVVVRADNRPNADMLPRLLSFDWAIDGGITRPVRVLASPSIYIARVDVNAVPDLIARKADIEVTVWVRNQRSERVGSVAAGVVLLDANGKELQAGGAAHVGGVAPKTSVPLSIRFSIDQPELWHFDRPYLYRLLAKTGNPSHSIETPFGIRKFEVRDGAFHLNGERVKLMGVERMAGSNPNIGMAETTEWIRHDHHDLKELNCVFTRVHWQQARRVLEFCDQHGILLQEEVPAWGPGTFQGMAGEPSAEILQNGIEQLREMISQHRNHPCVVAWGLCNEVDGKNPAAQQFIRKMNAEAKRLDPHRLTTYASNSLGGVEAAAIATDAAGELDFISWNEYYESWYPGTVADMRRNLEAIAQAFPGKPVVISEYGYCECAEGRTGGDARRAEILRTHDAVFRGSAAIGGLIFFCYNDYRTHIGDKGIGVLKQRVHGVVDLYGARKPSFDVLRREASPIEDFAVQRADAIRIAVRFGTRSGVPAYALDGYKLRWIVYGPGDLPFEQHEQTMAKLAPGARYSQALLIGQRDAVRIVVEILRPTGFSAATAEWRAARE